ncbi:MAG TPA: BBP7 family outer membrane beta-barrel protein [Thermoanaerobaculia bacterium]|nr:BBP7 family outer membrane beta-barrel protein [Thermoanaerobaculia bacterium]
MRNTVAGTLVLLGLSSAAASAQTAVSSQPQYQDPLAVSEITLKLEYLNWAFKNSPVPLPLITDGIVGGSSTHVLLGNDDLTNRRQDGWRLTFGYACDRSSGLEVSLLSFRTLAASKSVSSSGQPGSINLLLPYFDVNKNAESVTNISLSPSQAGTAAERLSRNLTSVEINGYGTRNRNDRGGLQFLGGFRWLNLSEEFQFATSSPFNPPQPADIWLTTDRFDARNNFYGLQAGVRGKWDWDRFSANGALKVGLGAMVQRVDIDGSLTTDDFSGTPGTTQRFVGGYFALPSNIGRRSRTVFGILPELEVGGAYSIAPWLSVSAGYSFLYTNNVARPGDQVNRNINTTQSVSWTRKVALNPKGPAQPSFDFEGSSFYAHGFNAGLTFRF